MTTHDILQEADGILDEKKEESTNFESTDEQSPSSKEKTEKESTPISEKKLTPDKTESSPKPKEAASETAQENNNIEEQKKDVNYNDYSLEALVSDFEELLKNDDLYSTRNKINAIRRVFNEKFSAILNDKKEAFLAEGGNSIDFSFDSPIKKQFNALSKQFRDKNEKYQKQKTQNFKENLESRLKIIENIKGLIDVSQSSTTTYNKFKDLYNGFLKNWDMKGIMNLFILINFLSSTILTQVPKNVFWPNVNRPIASGIPTSQIHTVPGVEVHTYNSFPSGHTATAFTLFLITVYFFPNRKVLMAGAIYALICGYSRIYLGQHFPLDIAGGIIAALLGVALSIQIRKKLFKKPF